MNIEYKKFARRVRLNNYLIEQYEIFESLINRGFDFQLKDGSIYRAKSVLGLAQNLNRVFKMNLVPENCRSVGGRYTLAFAVEGVEEKEEAPVITLDVVEEVVEEPAEMVISLEVQEEESLIDWDYVHGLKNTAPAKKELEAYVLEKTEGKVNLKRNKTIENMIVDLKAALKEI